MYINAPSTSTKTTTIVHSRTLNSCSCLSATGPMGSQVDWKPLLQAVASKKMAAAAPKTASLESRFRSGAGLEVISSGVGSGGDPALLLGNNPIGDSLVLRLTDYVLFFTYRAKD